VTGNMAGPGAPGWGFGCNWPRIGLPVAPRQPKNLSPKYQATTARICCDQEIAATSHDTALKKIEGRNLPASTPHRSGSLRPPNPLSEQGTCARLFRPVLTETSRLFAMRSGPFPRRVWDGWLLPGCVRACITSACPPQYKIPIRPLELGSQRRFGITNVVRKCPRRHGRLSTSSAGQS